MPTFVDVPEIKLIRTDTTLDLSQKAEKVCFRVVPGWVLKAARRPKGLWMAQKGLFTTKTETGGKGCIEVRMVVVFVREPRSMIEAVYWQR